MNRVCSGMVLAAIACKPCGQTQQRQTIWQRSCRHSTLPMLYAVPGEIIGFVEVIFTKVSPSTESIKASQNSSDQLGRGLLVGLFDCWDQCLRLVGKHTYGVLSGSH